MGLQPEPESIDAWVQSGSAIGGKAASRHEHIDVGMKQHGSAYGKRPAVTSATVSSGQQPEVAAEHRLP